jgi:alpha-beta hydrolase superfamily lysophospholipase
MADNPPVWGGGARIEPERTRRAEGFFRPARGVRLYRCEWSPERSGSARAPGALLVLLHGFAEHCRRYDELSEFLVQRGHVVCRFDARGHGRSSGQRGYIRQHQDYVEDLCAYVRLVHEREPERQLALIGHSNGGLIAIRALQHGLPCVSALVVTNPLLRLCPARRPVPDALAQMLSWAAGRLPLRHGLRPADLTHEPSALAAVRRDRWVHGKTTPRWYWSATLAGRAALEQAGSLTLPLLVVVGEQDGVVEPQAAKDFYERAASHDKQLISRPGEYHEVLNETDRLGLFALMADWLNSRRLELRAPQPALRP